MKQPKSTNSGTTGVWKKFVDSVNRMGEEEAVKRRENNKLNEKKLKKKF